MSVSSGFFNSELADRLYDATDFNKLVGSILVEGVIPFGGNLLVEENTGLTVNVQTGRAWFLDSWINNDAVLPITLDTADAAYNRYDIIALDFDIRQVTRANTIVVVKGNAAASPVVPTLVDTDDHKQYPLAVITVPAAATDLYQANIENKVGTEDCPFASGVLQQVTVDGLLTQWYDQFNTWFSNLQDELDSNQAANLQNQIDLLVDQPFPYRNLFDNGRMQINQRAGTPAPLTTTGFPSDGPDRWMIGINANGAVQVDKVTRADYGINRKWLRVLVTTASDPGTTTKYTLLQQRVEGSRLANAYFGTPYAKELTISFLFRSNVTGRYIVEFNNITHGSSNVSKYFDYNTADTTQKVTITFPKDVVNAISSNSAEGLRVNFWLSASTVFTGAGYLQESWGSVANARTYGQVNLMAAVNNYAMFTDLQLEIGSTAHEYDRLPDEVELLRCQRYYYAIISAADKRWIDVYVNGAPSQNFCHFDWPVVMRAVPLVYFAWVQNGVGSGWNFYCTSDTTRSQITEQHSTRQFSYRSTAANGSTGYTYQCELTYLTASADL